MADLQYEVNGGGLQDLGTISTAETHSSFYDYSSSSNPEVEKEAHHGYWEKDVLTVFVHHNTNDNTYAVIYTFNKPDSNRDQSVNYGARLNYSESIDPDSDVLVEDDPGEGWTSDSVEHGWGAATTDGGAIKASTFLDVTFTVDTPASGDNAITDFRVITSDGSAPDGGSVEYIGTSGSLRFRFEGLTTSPATVGDRVIMLREDLAVHGLPGGG